jgi:hypothetical protein
MKFRFILFAFVVLVVGICGSLSGQVNPVREVTEESKPLPEAVLLLKEYVAIPSVSGNELTA